MEPLFLACCMCMITTKIFITPCRTMYTLLLLTFNGKGIITPYVTTSSPIIIAYITITHHTTFWMTPRLSTRNYYVAWS